MTYEGMPNKNEVQKLHQLWSQLSECAGGLLDELVDTKLTIPLGQKNTEVTFLRRDPNFNGSDLIIFSLKTEHSDVVTMPTDKFFQLPQIKEMLVEKIINNREWGTAQQQDLLNYMNENGVSF